MTTESPNSKLVFTSLKVDIKNRTILENVSGEVLSGDMLAVMGSTGSGKTTLLNTLAGRISITAGEINLNGSPVHKQHRRRFGYVLQDNVLLSNLTLWETLYFSAMIKISEKVPKKEKIERINTVVESLGLQKCLRTVVGDIFNSGLSGGEKKRANIACELLADPDVLLIDEPTSGLDSFTANTIMKKLRNYAAECNKIIIVSIHQPSSLIFRMFSSLLLLSHGQTAFFGMADQAIDFVTGLGMLYSPNYNPADFLLDMLSSEENSIKMIAENRKRCELSRPDSNDITAHKIDEGHKGVQLVHFKTIKQGHEDSVGSHKSIQDSELSLCTSSISVAIEENKSSNRWPTSLRTQLKMLIWRSFKQSKGRIFHRFDLIQALCIGIMAGMLYFQIELKPNTIRDRMGLVFFTFIHMGFEVMMITAFGCCSDRGVFQRDRAAGTYRLSAYCLAKILSEMPLILTVPFLFYTALYWMAGLGDVRGYLIMCGVGALHCLIAQCLGDVIGALFTNNRLCITTVKIVNLGGLLLGGFYNLHPPTWFLWAKYVSIAHYPYAATFSYLSRISDPILCNQTSAYDFPQCLDNSTKVLSSHDIATGMGIELPIYCYIMTMLLALCFFRIIGYFVLKYKRI